MNIILTSAIIAFCGVLQIAVNDATMLEMRYELIEKEIVIMNATDALLKLKKEILAPDDIIDTSREFRANLTTLLNNAKRAIKTAGEAAIANGKSVEACVDPALANLTALEKTAFAEYTQAGENITRYTLDFVHQIDAAFTLGLASAAHVFAIPTVCYNNDTDIFAACFADSMKNTNEGLEAYRTAANNILADAESESTVLGVLELVLEWIFAVVAIAEQAEDGTETIQKTAIECIEAL